MQSILLQNTLEHANALRALSAGVERQHLIDPLELNSFKSVARKLFPPIIKDCMSAVTVIISKPFAELILKLMLKLDGIDIPVKTFKDKENALSWLRQFT